MKKLTSVFSLIFLILGMINQVSAQARFDVSSIEKRRAGESFRVEIKAEIEKKWHFYSLKKQDEDAPPPTSLIFKTLDFKKFGPPYESRPIVAEDKAIQMVLAFHEKKAFFYQNFEVPEGLQPGMYPLEVSIKYQLCDDRICLPPKIEKISLKIQIEEGQARTEYKEHIRTIEETSHQNQRLEIDSIWGFLLLAAGMGAASLLTPCVFPMVPITISYFTKQAAGEKKKVLLLALIFGAGIVTTYTGTGLIMSLLLGAGAVGQLASNPYVNLLIGIVFILFAFSLMGFFEFQLPAGWSGFFDQKARMLGGVTGVLLMGFTFTLTAFTCTVQFVGTLLISAAYGNWVWPLIGMLVFSTVFASPFVLLALIPSWIHKMQSQSGSWLVRAKVVLGLLEIMASVKFLSNADLVWGTGLISRNTAVLIWVVLLLVSGGYLIYTALRYVQTPSIKQMIIGTVFLGLSVAVGTGWNDQSLGGLIDSVLPPPSEVHAEGNRVSSEELETLKWHEQLDSALVEAKKQNKRILVDFTGYTCVNCRWMEQNMLPRETVFALLKDQFILARLYTDGGEFGEKNQQLQIQRFNTIALPFYVILTPENEVISSFTGMTYSEKEFIDFLQISPDVISK